MYFGYIGGCTSSGGGGGLCLYCMYVFAMPSSVRHMTTMARSGAAAKLLLLHHHRSPSSYSRLAASSSSSSSCCIPRSPPSTPFSRQISMEAQSIATQLNASGFLRTQGLIGGKWTDSYDGKTIKNSGTHSVQAKATIRENSNREKEIEPDEEEGDVDRISEDREIVEADMPVYLIEGEDGVRLVNKKKGAETSVDQIEDFKPSGGEYLQVDDEFFDTNIQREILVEEEQGEESDFEEYKTEEESVFEKDSDLGTSYMFNEPNPISTEHIDDSMRSEHSNTKAAGTPLHSPKNQPTPKALVSSSKLGNISPILPSPSNLSMQLSILHNRDLMDKGDASVTDPKLLLDSGNETHDTF
ncbi:hypothetical protein LguiA_016822 [Lonicera macranthoides]